MVLSLFCSKHQKKKKIFVKVHNNNHQTCCEQFLVGTIFSLANDRITTKKEAGLY